ncbi:MAG: hypothetical protein ABH851_00905 [Methanobacteriota archaeon]
MIQNAVFEGLFKLPAQAAEGGFFAVTALLIVSYLAFYVLSKLTALIVFFIKKVFLLAIVSLACYHFTQTLSVRIAINGFTQSTLLFGAVGSLAGVLGFYAALHAAFHSARNINTAPEKRIEEPVKSESQTLKTEPQSMLANLNPFPTLRDDRRLETVLTYLIIAEFGVFSSKTIAAPSETVGLGFFTAFMIAALLFIHQSYTHYGRGLKHLAAAIIVGGTLSILLGHYWSGIPLTNLLSPNYFSTDSLVALVTGLSVSLFMGSKG